MRYEDRERLARLWQDEVEIFRAARGASERLWRELKAGRHCDGL